MLGPRFSAGKMQGERGSTANSPKVFELVRSKRGRPGGSTGCLGLPVYIRQRRVNNREQERRRERTRQLLRLDSKSGAGFLAAAEQQTVTMAAAGFLCVGEAARGEARTRNSTQMRNGVQQRPRDFIGVALRADYAISQRNRNRLLRFPKRKSSGSS